GNNISLAALYIFPLFLISRYLNHQFGIMFSVICAAVIASAAAASGAPQSAALYWNSLIDCAIFIIVSILMSKAKRASLMKNDLVRIDSLTDIPNSKAFYEEAENEIKRSYRYGHPLTLVFIDCDNFNKVNDLYGHHAGDDLLASVAQTLKTNVRETDFVARIGGDEFVILMPETGSEYSIQHVRSLQSALLEAMKKNRWPVTFSIGVATIKEKTQTTVDEILKKSDSLMNYVKKHGKNEIKFKTY
ncbi:MAG: GGDEF domain-containing protein, partial [Spirochaetota bacterium]